MDKQSFAISCLNHCKYIKKNWISCIVLYATLRNSMHPITLFMLGGMWGSRMPRVANEMSAIDVKRLAHPGGKRNVLYSVGGVPGLHLQLTPKDGRSWVLRAKVGTRRRDIGLGGFPAVTLAQAREKAREARDKISQGIDPIEERKAAKAALATAQRRGLTFADATDKYLAAKLDAFKNAKHRQQWRNTLETYAKPELGEMLVQDILVQDVLRVLEPIWTEKTETASRLRGRIEAVLSWATVRGIGPATIRHDGPVISKNCCPRLPRSQRKKISPPCRLMMHHVGLLHFKPAKVLAHGHWNFWRLPLCGLKRYAGRCGKR